MQYFWEFRDYLSSSCAKKWTPLAFSLFCIVLIFFVFFSVDCGIYALKFMELWDRNIDLTRMIDQSDIPNIRVKLAVDLFFSKANCIDKSLVLNLYEQVFSFLYYLVVLLAIVWISFLFFPSSFFFAGHWSSCLHLVSEFFSWSQIINVISFLYMAANLNCFKRK